MKSGLALLLFVGGVFISFHFLQSLRELPQRELFLSPPQEIHHIHLGYFELLADSLWLRVIQDLDFCEKKDSSLPKSCGQQGWGYRMLNAITDLVPQFRMPYAAGSVVLSVLVGDRLGASALFEKGVKNIPKDWTIPYRAAYHYMLEDIHVERAAEMLLIAGKNGAPLWVYELAAKLYSKEGKREMVQSLLTNLEQDHFERETIERIKKSIEGKLKE